MTLTELQNMVRDMICDELHNADRTNLIDARHRFEEKELQDFLKKCVFSVDEYINS